MPDPDESYITSLRGAITLLCDGTADLYARHGGQVAPDSPAEKEIRESLKPEMINYACSSAQLLNDYSHEHLVALVKLLTDPIEPLAACTCVRSMLESCALSAWMMDPSIDHKERTGRVFAYRFEAFKQQLNYGNVAASTQPTEIRPRDLEDINQHIDDVAQDAIDLGYTPFKNSEGRHTGIGQRMPKATEIIRQVLDEEELYRLLSALAHGHAWAIIGVGFRPVEIASDATDSAGIGGSFLEKYVFEDAMGLIGSVAATVFAKALWNQWSYMGWDRAPLTVLLENVFDQLQAKACMRFWRSTTDTTEQ